MRRSPSLSFRPGARERTVSMGRGLSIGDGENRNLAYGPPPGSHSMPALEICDYRDHTSREERRRRAPEEPDGVRRAPVSQKSYHPRWAIMQLCITMALWVVVVTVVKLAISWL